ncbi:MAG TPA: serine hydrolase, partial [Dongiaceae bacterium]|nr:serine hydrolase [Dongiaceae bacterium]
MIRAAARPTGLALALALWAPVAGAAPRVADIEKLFEEQRTTYHVPGVTFVVVVDDKVVLLGARGLRDVEANRPVTPDTLFPIGSCTKAFTSMAIGVAQDAGRLTLDDSLHRWLPEVTLDDPEANELVTLRDLLCHRTGLKAYADLAAVPGRLSRVEYVRTAMGAKPVGKFRGIYQYSNAAVTAAGESVARAEKTTWERVVETTIFAPLGMTSSRTSSYGLPALPDGATGYNWDGTRWTAAPVVESLQAMAPAGSIASTARDLSLWLRMLTNRGVLDGRRFVSEATLDDLITPHTKVNDTMSYALGWAVYEWNGHRVIEHNGGSDGLSAIIGFIPDRRAGYALLANLSPTTLTKVGALGTRLWPLILDEEAKAATAPMSPPHVAALPPPPPTEPGELPTSEQVLARARRAAGGRNLDRHFSMRMTATGSYLNQGVGVELEVLAVDGKRVEDEILLGAGRRIGRDRQYFDGTHGALQTTFGQDATNGADEDARARRDASLHPLVDATAQYDKVRVDRRVDLDGEEAFVLALTPKTGDEVTWYVSARTWLIVRRDAAGETTRYSDFRNIDGEVVPFTMLTQGPLGERSLKAGKVEFNLAIPAGT